MAARGALVFGVGVGLQRRIECAFSKLHIRVGKLRIFRPVKGCRLGGGFSKVHDLDVKLRILLRAPGIGRAKGLARYVMPQVRWSLASQARR